MGQTVGTDAAERYAAWIAEHPRPAIAPIPDADLPFAVRMRLLGEAAQDDMRALDRWYDLPGHVELRTAAWVEATQGTRRCTLCGTRVVAPEYMCAWESESERAERGLAVRP